MKYGGVPGGAQAARDRYLAMYNLTKSQAGTNTPFGIYKGLRTTRTVSQAQGEAKFPPETVFTTDFDQNGINLEDWGSTPVFPHDKRTDLRPSYPNVSEAFLEFWKTIAESNGQSINGHPPHDIIHFDQVNLHPIDGSDQTTWSDTVAFLSSFLDAARGLPKQVSINFGGWNFHTPGILPVSTTTFLDQIASMCDWVSVEQLPHPRTGGLAHGSYQTIINNLRGLFTRNVGVQLIPHPHLLRKEDAAKYTIADVQVVTTGGNPWGIANGRTFDKKLLLTLDRPVSSSHPHPGNAPWERYGIGDDDIPGLPSLSWNYMTRWSAWPGPATNQMYVFVRNFLVNVSQLDDLLASAKSYVPQFEWTDLIGKSFYDLSWFERLQAATLLFAAPTVNNHFGGVHWAPVMAHPGECAAQALGGAATDKDDWRKWGQVSREPGRCDANVH